MANIKSISAFKFYLYNREFIVLSESKLLQHYRKTTSPARLITRRLQNLSLYDSEFKYIKGSTNILADYFSRNDFQLIKKHYMPVNV